MLILPDLVVEITSSIGIRIAEMVSRLITLTVIYIIVLRSVFSREQSRLGSVEFLSDNVCQ